jgi:hypothetical protein
MWRTPVSPQAAHHLIDRYSWGADSEVKWRGSGGFRQQMADRAWVGLGGASGAIGNGHKARTQPREAGATGLSCCSNASILGGRDAKDNSGGGRPASRIGGPVKRGPVSQRRKEAGQSESGGPSEAARTKSLSDSAHRKHGPRLGDAAAKAPVSAGTAIASATVGGVDGVRLA